MGGHTVQGVLQEFWGIGFDPKQNTAQSAIQEQTQKNSWILNFRPFLNVVGFLPGNSPAFEFYMSTFRNTVPSIYTED